MKEQNGNGFIILAGIIISISIILSAFAQDATIVDIQINDTQQEDLNMNGYSILNVDRIYLESNHSTVYITWLDNNTLGIFVNGTQQ